MKSVPQSTLAAISVVWLLFAAPASVVLSAAEATFERTLHVAGPVELEVTTGAGNITVRRGQASNLQVRGRVRTHGRWRASEQDAEEKVRAVASNPPIQQEGSLIRIGQIGDRELRRNLSISYELLVPVESRLRSETGSGDQSIDGIRGPVETSSGSGDLAISNIEQEVRASTGSGDIRLDSVHGQTRADAGSGSIRATRMGAGFVAETGSGNIHLEQTAPGDVRIKTGSGRVGLTGVRGALRATTGSGDLTVAGEPRGEWKLAAGSGNITVRLPAEAAFELHVHTGSGRIFTDHPVSDQQTAGAKELQGKVRGGGFLLEVKTGSGNIRIQ